MNANQMQGDMGEMLNRILSDPAALNGVMKLAGSLMNGQNSSPDSSTNQDGGNTQPLPPDNDRPISENNERPPSANPEQSMPNLNALGLGSMKLPKMLTYDKDRVRLLEALKPFLGDGRRDKVGYLLNIMQILRLLEGGNS